MIKTAAISCTDTLLAAFSMVLLGVHYTLFLMQMLINLPITFKPIYLSCKTITILLLFIPSLAFKAKLEETLLMQKSYFCLKSLFFNFVQVTIKMTGSEKK